MTIRAVSFLFPVFAAAIFAQPTASVDPESSSSSSSSSAAAAAAASPAAGDGGQAILLQHVESRTTSITVNWTVNSTTATTTPAAAAVHYDFQVLALSLNSGIVLVARPTNETEFTLTDLTVDTSYKVCVVAAAKTPRSSVVALAADVLEDTSDPDRDHAGARRRSCLLVSTIAYVRLDSIMVFLGVVAFVALSIAAAVFCWKRSHVEEPSGSAAATDEDDNGLSAAAAAAAADDAGFEEKKRSDEEQPLLDSDNNQYPPPPPPPPQKNSEPAPEIKVESEVEPVVLAGHQKSELPADGQADKPVSV